MVLKVNMLLFLIIETNLADLNGLLHINCLPIKFVCKLILEHILHNAKTVEIGSNLTAFHFMKQILDPLKQFGIC